MEPAAKSSPDKGLKDGHPVRPSQAVNFVNLPGGLVGLQIEAARPEDAGTYTLSVSNKLGEATAVAHVAVDAREKKPLFHCQLQPLAVVEGFPAKLEVKAVGHPPPAIKWTHNGKEVVPDGQHVKEVRLPDGTACLIIDKATPDDAGDYEVTASNEKGAVSSKGHLHVTGALIYISTGPLYPTFINSLFYPRASVVCGRVMATVSCVVETAGGGRIVTCDQKPLIREEYMSPACLERLGTPACANRLASVVVVKPQQHTVTSSGASQSGRSGRGIWNIPGKDRDAPEEKPNFLHELRDVSTDEGVPLVLGAPFIGNPIPDVTWTKDGVPFTPSDRVLLTCDGKKVRRKMSSITLPDPQI
ncbi:hypothetical protein PR048_026592, partial [Dryococelus australis]